MEENFEILSQCPLFSGISREDLSGTLQCLGPGPSPMKRAERSFWRGIPPCGWALSSPGKCRFCGRTWMETAASWPPPACRRIIETCSQSCIFHSQLIHNLLKIVARKNLMLNQKIDFISRRTTREKLMAYLTAQAKAADSRIFSIPYNRQELADYLGVERSAMSAELGKLKKEGTIDFHRNHFTLKDKTAKEDLK